jgi:hypothetical protein
MDNFDPKKEEHLEHLGRIMMAVGRVKPHAQLIYQSTSVLVFFAIADPEVDFIITPRPGSSKVPCPSLLDKFQETVAAESGPMWYPEDGLIFPPTVCQFSSQLREYSFSFLSSTRRNVSGLRFFNQCCTDSC